MRIELRAGLRERKDAGLASQLCRHRRRSARPQGAWTSGVHRGRARDVGPRTL